MANPSDSTSTSTRDNLTITMSGAQAYFGRSSKKTKQKVLERKVICEKRDWGKPGSCERDNHHAAATVALLYKFGSVKHFVPRNL